LAYKLSSNIIFSIIIISPGIYFPHKFPYKKNRKGKCCGKEHYNWKNGISKDTHHYSRERRNRELGAEGSHTTGDWETLKAQYNWTCLHCKKLEPTIKLTQDHIIPLSKGGSDNIENIQPLCKSCNSLKGVKMP